ncbi:MAG: TolC family protein [Flavobacterium sp.]|nr:TolC family protein [Flavobacterium sp.]
MKKLPTLIIALFALHTANAQQLELDNCLAEVNKNYPLLKQKNIEKEINAISNQLTKTAWLPQISVNGQATYQSDVTTINIPVQGFSVEPLSKYQYKAYLDINQTLYDGGVSKIKTDLQNLSSQISDSKVDIEIRNVIQQTQKYFFNALIAQENIIIWETTQNEIKSRIKVQESGVKYGSVKQSQVDILKVELLKIDQKIIEIKSAKKTALEIIALFSGLSISENAILKTPNEYTLIASDFGKRTEFKSYDFQKESIDKNYQLSTSSLLPKVSLFGQGGYGRPGLNQLSNEFKTYYIVGAKVNWDISSFFKNGKNKKISQFNKEAIEVQKSVLEMNLRSQKTSFDNEISKLNELIEKDKDIVDLRAKISKVAASELDNGISTATNYLIEKNAEKQALQSLVIHQIQKINNQYDIKLLTGN